MVSAVTGATSSGGTEAATPASAAAGGTAQAMLGKDDFLKLLLAQLSNQDPLRPMEDTEFIAQLAQLNTLEQTQQMNQHLVDLVATEGLSQAFALLGQEVEAVDSTYELISGSVTAAMLVDGQPWVTVGETHVPLSAVIRAYTSDAPALPASPAAPAEASESAAAGSE
jgi:flagellar basal-body rod modification protein FlgD